MESSRIEHLWEEIFECRQNQHFQSVFIKQCEGKHIKQFPISLSLPGVCVPEIEITLTFEFRGPEYIGNQVWQHKFQSISNTEIRMEKLLDFRLLTF